MHRRLALLVLVMAFPAAADSEVQWMKVLLDGQKIGHARSERRVEDATFRVAVRVAFASGLLGLRLGRHHARSLVIRFN